MSQLGLGLGLTRGGGVPFNPLSLNPYLLFDTRSSMIGTFENPTLDLDPSDPDTLDVITATRAGVATYTDADGLIQSADPNTVRVDHSLGYPAILVEPSATNLVEYSEDFSISPYWNMVDVSVSTAPVAAPDGTMTASHIVATGPDAHIAKVGIVTSGSDTVSIWARTVSGAGTCSFNYHGGTPITVTEEWQRFEVTANTNHVYAVNFRGDATLDEIYIWGAQAEAGSVATSYIPTSGSTVTRAADDLVIDGSDFSDFFSTTENTFYCEFDPRPSDEVQFLLCSQASSARFIYGTSNNSWYIYDGTSSSVFGTESSTGLQRAAATFDGTSKEASLNGGGENTSSHNGNLLNVPTELRIGKAYYGGGYLNGHIKRVIWWPYSSDRL